MHAIGPFFDWFLSATLRGSLLVVLVLIVQVAIGRRLPAGWRHALWLPVLFVLGSPVLPRSPWSVENHWQVTTAEPRSHAVGSSPDQSPSSTAPVAATPMPATIAWRVLAGWIWMAGALAVLFTGVTACLRALRGFHRGSIPLSVNLRAEIEEAVRACGLRRVPRVLVSSTVPGPAMTGLFRPLLLLPASFESAFDHDERRLILRHEFTHVKRGDLLVNGLVVLLQALHWCNPIVWFAFVRFRADRELACDRAVLSMDREDERSRYGLALLKVESAVGPVAWRLGFLGLVGLFGRGRLLSSRITAIAGHRPAPAFWNVAGPALLVAVALTGATRAQSEPPADAPQIVIEAKFIEVPADSRIEILSERASLDSKSATTVFPADTKLDETLASTPGADILSAPSVVTLSGQKATVEIGVPRPDANGRPKFVGTRLEVLPKLADGKIHLALQFHQTEQDTSEGTTRFSERDLKTDLTVEPGDIVMVTSTDHASKTDATRQLILTVRTRIADPPDLVQDRLAKITIPTIEFRDTPLGDALAFLREKTRELDPEKLGVNLVHIPVEGAPEPKLTVSFRQIPLTEALKYIAALSDLEVEYGAIGVLLRAPSGEPTPEASMKNPPSGKAAALADAIVLPQAAFEEVPLPSVLEVLQQKSRELDPEKKGLALVLKAPGEPAVNGIKITLTMRNISLFEALRHVAQLAGLELRFDEDAAVLFRE